MEVETHDSVVELVHGDVTEMDTDAIVNAANTQLLPGGGVAGAIKQKGGPAIQEECNRIGGAFEGSAVITGGGNLSAKHVIHAVGPRMGEGDEDNKLKNATLNSLKIAANKGVKSISFPAISTGIFGFPTDRCAGIMLSSVMNYLEEETGIKKVVFCLFGQESLDNL